MPGAEPIFLAGPTGSGKSAIALALAPRVEGEIISVDSMQVYRGMDIGTAKASAAEQRQTRHHLISILDLDQSFDAAQFVQLAKTAAADIAARGRIPIFCGGTGLYFQAYLKGLGQAPPSNHKLRSELERISSECLLQELQESDPVTYAQIDRKNRRRVIRALEVIRLTGTPFSEQRAGWHLRPGPSTDASGKPGPSNFFCLAREREDLYHRIDERVEKMFAFGLVEETRKLVETGLATNRTALQALGYRQVYEYLAGQYSLTETIERVKRGTRQYAKRQMTWFRRQAEMQWLPVAQGESPRNVAERIDHLYGARRAATAGGNVP